MQNAPHHIVAQWGRSIIGQWRPDYARYDHNIWSEVATAAVKPSAKRTTKGSEISKTAVLREPRMAVKGAARDCEISNTSALRICAL